MSRLKSLNFSKFKINLKNQGRIERNLQSEKRRKKRDQFQRVMIQSK